MARKKNDNTPDVVKDGLPQQVAETLTNSQNAADEHSALITAQFGDGLPYERTRVVTEARFFMAQSAEAMLEAGKRLIMIKEHEPHGEFTEIVENELGLAKRTAQLMMQAALKYLSPKLQSKAQALALLGKTKLFELLTEDDDDLAELVDGGTVAGMALDDIERMTSRELRAALRESKEQAQAKDQILADKNARIDDLSSQLAKARRRIKSMSAEEAQKELRREVGGIAYEVEIGISTNIREAFKALLEVDDAPDESGVTHRAYMATLLFHLEEQLAGIRDEFQLPDVTDDSFAWINGKDGDHAEG